MSSILEALRKSDDKRKQGHEGGVDNIQFSESQKPAKSRKGFNLLVLILLLVAAAVWAYQSGYLPQIKNMFSSENADSMSTVDLVTGEADKDKATKESMAKTTPEQKNKTQTAQKNTLKPPKPESVKKQIVANKKAQIKPEGDGSKDGVITVTDKPLNKPSETKKDRLVVDGKKVSEVKNNKKIKKKPVEEAKESKQDYLLVHQLPFAIRQQIPTLKVNVHVYDPNPENRLVIINGISFNIGDSIEEVATIKEITSEGVVVDISGTVFLIPK